MKYIVSEEFVNQAEKTAQALKELTGTEKTAAVATVDTATVEMVADTLVAQGLIPATEKAAACTQLADHKEALIALNATALVVGKEKTAAAAEDKSDAAPVKLGGGVNKLASNADSSTRPSDKAFLDGLERAGVL